MYRVVTQGDFEAGEKKRARLFFRGGSQIIYFMTDSLLEGNIQPWFSGIKGLFK